MKKTLLFAAAILAATTMKAQDDETIVKYLYEVCNYLDIQAERDNENLAASNTFTDGETASNGTVFYESTTSSSASTWNVKDGYTDARHTPELAGVMDTLYTGTMFRARSGATVVLGAFTTTANGKIQVYWQPNGDGDRGVSISYQYGGTATHTVDDTNNPRGCYCTELDIEAGEYYAGDIVITIVSNTCNIFGVNIENLEGTTAISSTMADAGISYNGREILNPQAKSLVVYNILGKRVAQSNGNISLDGFQSGIYVVRAEGIQQALKIKK